MPPSQMTVPRPGASSPASPGLSHGGSHPHLADTFLKAVLGKQPAFPDGPTSANWTMVGICAHQSALKGGERVNLPVF